MLCNSRIKFGAFVEFLQRNNRQFDRIASGHYAQLLRRRDGDGHEAVELGISADTLKDQTYFLAQLDSRQLARCMFPLGRLYTSLLEPGQSFSCSRQSQKERSA